MPPLRILRLLVVASAFSVFAAGCSAETRVGTGVETETRLESASQPQEEPVAESESRQLTEDHLAGLPWRSVGPANMGGRVAALAFAPGNCKTYFVGYGTGGLWKTTNAGTTFSPVFDTYETSSIGSVVVCDAPPEWPGWTDEEASESTDTDENRGRAKIIWVGTGEGNGRNSSSWGHGVYRSTDGGGEFVHLGLEDTHDIPSLSVDPTNPDTCYVAAMGHLWGPNDQRGVFRTTDGGETWDRVLYINETTGACDVIVDPANPDTVYAAMYTRQRRPWSFTAGGADGGIFKSTDGGDTWTRLDGGLPGSTGRIGLTIFPGDTSILYAVVESDEGGVVGGPFADFSRSGGVFRSEDGGETWERRSHFAPRAFYFSRIKVDPQDDQRIYLLGWDLSVSDDGGRTFRNGLSKILHVDFHAIAIDPDDTDHIIIGNDGGVYESHDRGETWVFHNTMAVGQFYNIALDDSDPYRIAGGLQDNGSWIGVSANLAEDSGEWMSRKGAITNAQWQFIWGGDGFHVAFDPEDPNIIYAESQGGWIGRLHLDTGLSRTLRPTEKEGQPLLRFNWNAPFFISPHDPTTLYLGGNFIYRLTQRGDRWERISPDLSTSDVERIRTVGSDAETYGTVVSLAESPLSEGVLWAGTDEGLIYHTRDGGATWNEITPDGVDGRWISKIEPSKFDDSAAFVAIDGHRSDRFEPMLLKTADNGRTWVDITGDIPHGHTTKVIRQDPHNPEVLYVGTERAAYVTINGGESWVRLNHESLPTVAVDDLAIQEREMDLVAGTHGRSVWILDDISSLSQLTPEIVASDFHAFEPMPGTPRFGLPYGGLWSHHMFVAENPPAGALLHYWVGEWSDDEVSITITSVATDRMVGELTGPARPGINRLSWDMQIPQEERIGNPDDLPEFVPAGEYEVTMNFGDHSQTVTLVVEEVPGREWLEN